MVLNFNTVFFQAQCELSDRMNAMYAHPQKRSSEEVQELRREAGRWLRDLREARGLSQRQLADLTHCEYYTFISQLETGRGRIPPDRYRDWAQALGVPARDFVRELLAFYDPVTYDILFGAEATSIMRSNLSN